MNSIRHYVFGPLDRPTSVAGVRLDQALTVFGGFLFALTIGGFMPRPGRGPFTFLCLVAAAVAAFLPVMGQSVAEWVLVFTRFFVRRRRRTRNGSNLDGTPVLPGVLILDDPVRGGAVIRERLGRDVVWSSVLQVRGRDFAIASPEEQARVLDRWGDVLAARCRENSPLRRIQVLDRAIFAPSHAHMAHLHCKGDPASPFFSAYEVEQLELSPFLEHQAFLVVQVARSRARTNITRAGGGDVGGMAVLREEVDRLVAELKEVLPGGAFPVTSHRLAWVLRSAYDSGVTRFVHRETSPEVIAPAFEEESFSHYQTQDSFHATLWVREWPRLAVGPGFQLPLLLETPCTRSFSIVYEPIAPSRSLRDAQTARTAQVSDLEIRHKHGFLDTARRQMERIAVQRREEELAAGHQELRFCGYLTVTAPSADELASAVAEVEAKARQAQLDTTRMVGDQARAFTFTLPLCRGLR
jgi:hypothetical protein